MITITKKIKDATFIVGFQSPSLVGPIVIQYLLDHLKFEPVGEAWFDGIFPLFLVYQEKLIKPMTLFYNEEHNIVLLQALIPAVGIEWRLAEAVESIAEKIKAKQIITLEGVETEEKGSEIFYISNCGNEDKIKKSGAIKLKNAMLFGVTSIFLIKEVCPLFCLLGKLKHIYEEEGGPVLHSHGETSVHLIEFLNKYLDIKVDTASLLQKSKNIENQIKKLSKEIPMPQDKKPSYFG